MIIIRKNRNSCFFCQKICIFLRFQNFLGLFDKTCCFLSKVILIPGYKNTISLSNFQLYTLILFFTQEFSPCSKRLIGPVLKSKSPRCFAGKVQIPDKIPSSSQNAWLKVTVPFIVKLPSCYCSEKHFYAEKRKTLVGNDISRIILKI